MKYGDGFPYVWFLSWFSLFGFRCNISASIFCHVISGLFLSTWSFHMVAILVAKLLTWSLSAPKVDKDKTIRPSSAQFYCYWNFW